MVRMQGLSFASIKKHPSLIPLFVALGCGVSMTTLFTLRTALKNPDVSWDRKNNPEPNQHYADKPFKFIYHNPASFKPSPAPKYQE